MGGRGVGREEKELGGEESPGRGLEWKEEREGLGGDWRERNCAAVRAER